MVGVNLDARRLGAVSVVGGVAASVAIVAVSCPGLRCPMACFDQWMVECLAVSTEQLCFVAPLSPPRGAPGQAPVSDITGYEVSSI